MSPQCISAKAGIEGDMILKAEEPIYPTDTAGALHDRLAVKALSCWETLKQIAAGTAPAFRQGS